MATSKTAAKADKKEPKAPKAAPAAAPTTSPPADPPASQPTPSTTSPEDTSTTAAQPTEAAGADQETGGRKWVAHEIVDGVAQPVGQVTATVHRLERAQALPELTKGTGASGELVADGIQSFKDTDGRTMNVVVSGGALFKQEV
jgi:hypothetical protein